MVRALFLLVFLVSSGCSFQKSVVRADKAASLSPDQGYILLGLSSDYSFEKIRVKGRENFFINDVDFLSGDNYLLLPLKSGDYRLSRLFLSRYWQFNIYGEDFSFSVMPGVINYVGDLSIRESSGWNAHFYMENKSSLALEYLEDKFPLLLASARMHYSGPGEDTFFDYIRGLGRGRADSEENS